MLLEVQTLLWRSRAGEGLLAEHLQLHTLDLIRTTQSMWQVSPVLRGEEMKAQNISLDLREFDDLKPEGFTSKAQDPSIIPYCSFPGGGGGGNQPFLCTFPEEHRMVAGSLPRPCHGLICLS